MRGVDPLQNLLELIGPDRTLDFTSVGLEETENYPFETARLRQVTELGAASFAPYFFPSGDRILFSTNHGDPTGREFDIWAVNVDGSDLEQITFSPGFDGFPMFSPDGSKLAFASNRNQKKPGETNVCVADWVVDPSR